MKTIRHRFARAWRRGGCAALAPFVAGAMLTCLSASASAAPCANESLSGFHSYLPDCGAYEMVSPPYKAGRDVENLSVSPDGSRVLAASLSAFAGTPSDSNAATGAVYRFERGAGGWTTQPLSPPASVFPASEFFGASADFNRSAWVLRLPSQSINADDLYIRDANGSFVKVGPMVPPQDAVGPPAEGAQGFTFGLHIQPNGASSDLTHITFKNLVPTTGLTGTWPGDTTVHGNESRLSLYEYSGTGNLRPELVGVDDDGRLISDCGTTLGSRESQDTYNAISASGEVVYFTASGRTESSACETAPNAPEVSEVYARLSRVTTLPISQPAPSQCGACLTTRDSPEQIEALTAGTKSAIEARPAEFVGASSAGDKAFFTTEQELLFGQKTNNLYEYDLNNASAKHVLLVSGGQPAHTTTEPEVQGVARISQDGTHVYFVAHAVLTGPNSRGTAPIAGEDNLYLFERDAANRGGTTTFLATLAGEQDESDWERADERSVQTSPDGRYLVFTSVGDLVPSETATARQVFEYDAVTEELVRVSVAQAGYPAGALSADERPSRISVQSFSRSAWPEAAGARLAVSADGTHVFFLSAAGLTPQGAPAAMAGVQSAYEYVSKGTIADGAVHLISNGTDSARLVGLDPTGLDAFFATSGHLLPQDGDNLLDTFDARAGGGALGSPGAIECEGEACQGPQASPAGAFGAPASTLAQPEGSLRVPSAALAPRKAESASVARRQALARALRACKKKPRHRRPACERNVRRRLGTKGAKQK
jgi:hypothetical protein